MKALRPVSDRKEAETSDTCGMVVEGGEQASSLLNLRRHILFMSTLAPKILAVILSVCVASESRTAGPRLQVCLLQKGSARHEGVARLLTMGLHQQRCLSLLDTAASQYLICAVFHWFALIQWEVEGGKAACGL